MLSAKRKKENKHIQRKLTSNRDTVFLSMEPREEVNPTRARLQNRDDQSSSLQRSNWPDQPAGQTEIERHGPGAWVVIWCGVVLYVSCKVYQICNRTHNTFWTLSSIFTYVFFLSFRLFHITRISTLPADPDKIMSSTFPDESLMWVEPLNSVVKLSDLTETISLVC